MRRARLFPGRRRRPDTLAPFRRRTRWRRLRPALIVSMTLLIIVIGVALVSP
jgi:hypothetical protein